MLSRFSLPGVGTLFSGSNHSQKELNAAVSKIKVLGKRSSQGTNESSLCDIQEILSVMGQYSESLSVQRVACHALSNLAMQVVSARWIVQKKGLGLILNAVDRFIKDQKLCWLASSAVWNLARPPANRASIGKQGAKAMLKILSQHSKTERVANTAIGALSNLSLLEDLKDLIAEPQNLEMVLAVLKESLDMGRTTVMTSGAGLLANIAVSDEHASKLVEMNTLDIILALLAWPKTDETLFRNACAALNNLVSADGFLNAFLRARGLESVLEFLDKHGNASEDGDGEEGPVYAGLLDNCLATIDAQVGVQTTSLHYACLHGQLDILKVLYSSDAFDLDCEDGRNMTCLDYAISSGHCHIVEWLAKLGAKNHGQADLNADIEAAIRNGAKTLAETRNAHGQALEDTLAHFPTDLCKFMLDFQPNHDMLESMNRF